LIASERVEAPPPSPSRLSRYERIVMEACKQCGRRVLPAMTLGALSPPDAGVLAILLAHGEGVAPLRAVLAGPKAAEVWLAVGPEGGFSDDEIEAAVASGWRRASLGPRVLRTETAGAIASALVLHTWGDLGV
jgi:16S rRNA (uracil1498-N3)-methyltransferase